MSYLSKFITAKEAIPRDVRIGEVTETCYFRRITAAERQKLLTGQRVMNKAGAAEVEVELGANEKTKHQMVFYSVVTPEGDRYFKNVAEVGELPAQLISALFREASDINKDDEDPGKS